jgi:hypothetical protein
MNKTLLILCFIFNNALYSQNFKEVTTGQDVIDNYIEANGGAENLKSIESIEMKGNINAMGMDVPLTVYTSKDYFYMDAEHPQLGMTIVTDLSSNNGWTKFMGKISDAKEADIEKNRMNIESMLWTYYINKDKYGISYELMQNEKIGDNDTYVVDFRSGDSVIQTVNFDTKTFYRVKQFKGNTSSEYGEFKSVDGSGIYMPYVIKTNQGDVSVSSYKFNSELDRKLLNKPEETIEK